MCKITCLARVKDLIFHICSVIIDLNQTKQTGHILCKMLVEDPCTLADQIFLSRLSIFNEVAGR